MASGNVLSHVFVASTQVTDLATKLVGPNAKKAGMAAPAASLAPTSARQQVDYLSDPRIGKLTAERLKKHLEDSGKVPAQELSAAETKFALVQLAESKGVVCTPMSVFYASAPDPEAPCTLIRLTVCKSREHVLRACDALAGGG